MYELKDEDVCVE